MDIPIKPPGIKDTGEPAVLIFSVRLMPRASLCFTPLLLNVLMVSRPSGGQADLII